MCLIANTALLHSSFFSTLRLNQLLGESLSKGAEGALRYLIFDGALIHAKRCLRAYNHSNGSHHRRDLAMQFFEDSVIFRSPIKKQGEFCYVPSKESCESCSTHDEDNLRI